MGKTNAPYSEEFRREALELLRSSGKSVPQLADELGIAPQTLRNWRRQDEIDAGQREGVSSDERARLRELERENQTLRRERELLKKAAAFFATETSQTR